MKEIDLPSAWSGKELLDMLDNSGDGLLQRAEFTTNFFRLLDSDGFQHLCLMSASINQVKHMITAVDKSVKGKLLSMETDLASIRTAVCAPGEKRQQPSEVEHLPDKALAEPCTDEHPAQHVYCDEVARGLDAVWHELREEIQKSSETQLGEIHRVLSTSLQNEFASLKLGLSCARAIDCNDDLSCPLEYSPLSAAEIDSSCARNVAECKNTAVPDDIDMDKPQLHLCPRLCEVNPDGHELDFSLEFEFKDDVPLGCEICWVRDQLPLIGKVVPGGASAMNGVRVDDRLVECNGVLIAGRAREEVLQLLRVRPLLVRMLRRQG